MRVLVTGGGSDIGSSIVGRRIALGDQVVITASSEASLEKALQGFQDQGLSSSIRNGAIQGLVFDLASPDQAEPALDRLLGNGAFEGLVLNACTRTPPLYRLHEMPEKALRETVNANILGNTWLIRKLLPSMMERKFGRIVFISSISAINGTGRYAGYIMAKAALEGLVLNLAVDYGQFNILSNTVRLGIFKTERNRKYWSRDGYIGKIGSIIPQASLGDPSQVGEALDPLLSHNQYINGSVLAVGGGFPMIRLEGVLRS